MSYLGQGLGLGREERFTATATAGQTTITLDDQSRGIAYTPGYVDVFLNGIKMVNGQDVTVTSGTSVVFASALAAGDVVDIVAPGYFQPADTVSRSLGGTFLGAVNLPSGGLNVGSGQLQVDSSGRVTMSGQPMFLATAPGSSFTPANSAITDYSQAIVNKGSCYNTGTGRFTAPVAGVYYFFHQATARAVTSSTYEVKIYLNSTIELSRVFSNGAGYGHGAMAITIVSLAANDFVQAGFYNGPGVVMSGGADINASNVKGIVSGWGGYLLG